MYWGGQKQHFAKEDRKHEEVERRACHMSQILMSNCLYRRQVKNKQSTLVHRTRDLLLQVAIGLTSHGLTRSQFLVNFVHSIDYSRVL